MFNFLKKKLFNDNASRALMPTSVATAERIKNILGTRDIDSMPAQAARAFQLACDPAASAAQFVEVIESDEGLSSRVIRIANSVYYFRGVRAADIQTAVANIGLDELRCLLSATLLRNIMAGRDKRREQVWGNALATGIACRGMARTVGTNQGAAFLCGLVHDIGKLMIIRRGAELYDKVLQRVASGNVDFIQAEEEIFQTNHVEVGKWLAEQWNFPENAVRAIAFHHEPWAEVPDRKSPEVMVKAADILAHACGLGHRPEMRKFQERAENELPQALSVLGVSTENRDSFIKKFKADFENEQALYSTESN